MLPVWIAFFALAVPAVAALPVTDPVAHATAPIDVGPVTAPVANATPATPLETVTDPERWELFRELPDGTRALVRELPIETDGVRPSSELFPPGFPRGGTYHFGLAEEKEVSYPGEKVADQPLDTATTIDWPNQELLAWDLAWDDASDRGLWAFNGYEDRLEALRADPNIRRWGGGEASRAPDEELKVGGARYDPRAVGIGDTDADGRDEVFSVDPSGDLLRWTLGADGWSSGVVLAQNPGGDIVDIVLGDVDGDGKDEIVYRTDLPAIMILDDLDRAFERIGRLALPRGTVTSMALGDVDADSKDEIVVAVAGATDACLRLSQVCDLAGATCQGRADCVTVFAYDDEDQGFRQYARSPPVNGTAIEASPPVVRAGNFDKDYESEVFLALLITHENGTILPVFQVYDGQPRGSFVRLVHQECLPYEAIQVGIEVDDITQDGMADVVCHGTRSARVTAFFNVWQSGGTAVVKHWQHDHHYDTKMVPGSTLSNPSYRKFQAPPGQCHANKEAGDYGWHCVIYVGGAAQRSWNTAASFVNFGEGRSKTLAVGFDIEYFDWAYRRYCHFPSDANGNQWTCADDGYTESNHRKVQSVGLWYLDRSAENKIGKGGQGQFIGQGSAQGRVDPGSYPGWHPVRLLPGDFDGDSVRVRFLGRHWVTISNVIVMAAVAAPPAVAGTDQEGSVTFGQSRGNSAGTARSLGLTAGVNFGFQIDENICFGIGVTRCGTEAKFGSEFTVELETVTTRTEAMSNTFVTGKGWTTNHEEDMVIFTAILYDHYEFEYVSHPNVEWEGQSFVISFPGGPKLLKWSREKFNRAVLAQPELRGLEIDSRVFKHAPGDPSTYSAFGAVKARAAAACAVRGGLGDEDVKCDRYWSAAPADFNIGIKTIRLEEQHGLREEAERLKSRWHAMTLFSEKQTVGEGRGSTSLSVEVEKESESEHEWELSGTLNFGWHGAFLKGGFKIGAQGGETYTISASDGLSVEAEVGDLAGPDWENSRFDYGFAMYPIYRKMGGDAELSEAEKKQMDEFRRTALNAILNRDDRFFVVDFFVEDYIPNRTSRLADVDPETLKGARPSGG